MDTPNKTLRDLALDAVPTDLREPLLMLAAEHHIASPDDPFWIIASATASAMAAAKAAGTSAGEIKSLLASLPRELREGAKRAAEDLKSEVLLAAKSVAAIVATGLDKNIEATKQQAVAEWKAALGRGIDAKVREGMVYRLALSWGVVAASIGVSMILGAVMTMALLHTVHHLTPAGVHFYASPNQSEIVFSKPIASAHFVRCPTGSTASACMDFLPRK